MIVAPARELDFGLVSMIEVRGTAIELFRAGAGAPLLFLHGLDGLDGAAEILAELARSFDVIAPSMPGFGGSDTRAGCDRIDDLGYFMLDLIDELRLDAPIIVGSSLGGWLAAEMLTKEPRRAATLVLVSPLGLVTAERRIVHVADIFVMPRKELAARMQAGAPAPLADIMHLPEERLRRAMRNDEAASRYGWTPYMCNPRLADRIHRIACPTTIVWGGEDAIVRPSYRELWSRALPVARVEILPAAGHRAHSDQPQRLAALIGDVA